MKEPRSGRPPDVSEENILRIRKELSENPSGWKVNEIMNIIYERTGVKYHEVHIYRLLHKWNFTPKAPRKRFVSSVSSASKEQREHSKKRLETISHIPKDFKVAVEDESIFVHDALIRRRMWSLKEKCIQL